MASLEIPVRIELPDDWAERIADSIIKRGDYVKAVRCHDCVHWQKESCPMKINTLDDDYCSAGVEKEW